MPETTSEMDSSDSDDHSKQELCNSSRSIFEDDDTDASLEADELHRKVRKRQKIWNQSARSFFQGEREKTTKKKTMKPRKTMETTKKNMINKPTKTTKKTMKPTKTTKKTTMNKPTKTMEKKMETMDEKMEITKKEMMAIKIEKMTKMET